MANQGNPGVMANQGNPGVMANQGNPCWMANQGNPGVMANQGKPGVMANQGCLHSAEMRIHRKNIHNQMFSVINVYFNVYLVRQSQ